MELTNFTEQELLKTTALVGYAVRLPNCNSIQELYEILSLGKDAISPVPAGRWADETNSNFVKEAGFLKCSADLFDSTFFGLSPAELIQTDPQQRLSIEVAWEAFENAGIDPYSINRLSIFCGSWRYDYNDLMAKSTFEGRDFFRTYIGNAIGATVGRLAKLFKATGPSLATESGCSSSAVAMGLAHRSLLNDECDVALCVGVNLLLKGFSVDDYPENFLSPDLRCKTFDQEANGFVRAEGCIAFILKKCETAVKEGDKVFAFLRGYGCSQDGKSDSIGTPTVEGEALALTRALQDAQLPPCAISYIETHGTGTSLGDDVEIRGIDVVYNFEERQRTNNPLYLGSLKANIGHTESVSGMAGVLKVLLSFEKHIIFKQINLQKLSEKIHLPSSGVYIPSETQVWTCQTSPRYAAVSSFGLTGTNTNVILQEVVKVPQNFKSLPLNLLPLSAKSLADLIKVVDNFREFLLTNPSVNLSSVAYTLSVGRPHWQFRTCLISENVERAVEQCTDIEENHYQCKSTSLVQLYSVKIPNDPQLLIYTLTAIKQEYLSGQNINWREVYAGFEQEKLQLPNYPLTKKTFWFPTLHQCVQEDASNFNKPKAYTEKWQLVDAKNFLIRDCLVEQCQQITADIRATSPKEGTSWENLKTCIGLGILKALLEMGMPPCSIGDSLVIKDMHQVMQISGGNYKLFKTFLFYLVEDGYFSLEADGEVITVNRTLPAYHEIKDNLSKILSFPQDSFEHEWKLANKMLPILAPALQSKISVLEILFPENDWEYSAETFYNHSTSLAKANTVLLKIGKILLQEFLSQNCKSVFNILEIGAGTGSATEKFLPLLHEMGINYFYTFTDITAGFISQGKEKFSNFLQNMEFKVFNVEISPTQQGFSLQKYDLIIASNVIHATSSISESLINIRKLLKNNGIFLLLEGLQNLRHWDISFGFLPGFWCFSDFHLRPAHCLINELKWRDVLEENGFANVHTLPIPKEQVGVILSQRLDTLFSDKQTWVLVPNEFKHLTKLKDKLGEANVAICHEPGDFPDFTSFFEKVSKTLGPITDIIYKIKNCNPNEMLERSWEYLHFLKAILHLTTTSPRVYILIDNTRKESSLFNSVVVGISRTFLSENDNKSLKIIEINDQDLDSFTDTLISEVSCLDGEHFVMYKQRKKYVARLEAFILPQTPKNPKFPRFKLFFPKSRKIEDLCFISSEKPCLQPNQIEIRVLSLSLNFRDVFAVLKPTKEFDLINTIGSDVAGIVTRIGDLVNSVKVGDSVFGLSWDNTFSNFAVLNSQETVILPKHLTYCDGSTLPCVFATAYDSLVKVGGLTSNDTLLIHSATGGVGLMAIQIAKLFNCKVICTVGSERKRLYLLGLGITNIFSSRNTDFAASIQNLGGVTIVLNTLTGPGFKEATLSCCLERARFLEISKVNVWPVSHVYSMRPDVTYKIVDLNQQQKHMPSLMEQLEKLLQNKSIQPLPQELFLSSKVKDALTFLKEAKHIGKVTLIMNDMYLHANATYLITGGTQGIGIEIAQFLVERGAQHLVLCSRGEVSEENYLIIDKLISQGCSIHVRKCDVGSISDCTKLFSYIDQQCPPLRGVIHSAGALHDATIPNQTLKSFETVYKAKVQGTWNLHLLTCNRNLDFFTLFSSFAKTIGMHGQSNHAAANSFMSAVSHYRQNIGLKCLCINWGAWKESGVFQGHRSYMFQPLLNKPALEAFGCLMFDKNSEISIVGGDPSNWQEIYPWTKTFVQNILTPKPMSTVEKSGEVEQLTSIQHILALEHHAQLAILESQLISVVCDILQLEKNPDISTTPFETLGLDSIMRIGLRNRIMQFVGDQCSIEQDLITESENVHKLTQNVLQVAKSNFKTDKWDSGLVEALLKSDCCLWPHIKLGPELEKASEISAIKTVLITGITGHLAPYLLCSLFTQFHIGKAYCLMRPGNKSDKLNKILKAVNISYSSVYHVEGDLTKDHLGMELRLYDKLALEIEAVFHCAVQADHLQEYKENTGKEKNDPRSVNVLGLQRLLEFITCKKLKHFYYASTLAAVLELDEQGRLPESWPKPHEYIDPPNFGYAISKFVCERILAQAVEVGLPCKVMRFPVFCGHSVTGAQDIKTNHFYTRTLHYLQAGVMPDMDVFLLQMPIDKCADLSLQVFFKSNFPGVFNILNEQSLSELDLPQFSKQFGIVIKVKDYQAFVDSLEQAKQHSCLYHLKEFYTDKDRYTKFVDKFQLLHGWRKDRKGFFAASKVKQIVPNFASYMEDPYDILTRDITYLIKNHPDLFPQLNLKHQ